MCPPRRFPDDAQSGETLLHLNCVVDDLPAAQAERFLRVLVNLVTRYQAANRQDPSRSDAAMAEVLRSTTAVFGFTCRGIAADRVPSDLRPHRFF